MRKKTPNREALETEKDRIERPLALRAARWFDRLLNANVNESTTAQKIKLAGCAGNAEQFLRSRLTDLSCRLAIAFNRARLASLFEPDFTDTVAEHIPPLLHTAYVRERIIHFMLSIMESVEYRRFNMSGDDHHCRRIRHLREAWELADKGPLVESPAGCKALRLLRMLYFQAVASGGRIEDINCGTITESLLCEDDGEFEAALAKAKRLRTARRQHIATTEEDTPRIVLTSYAVVCSFLGITAAGDTQSLIGYLAPGWKGDKKNFEKLLDECSVPRTRRPRGRPRKNGYASRGEIGIFSSASRRSNVLHPDASTIVSAFRANNSRTPTGASFADA